MTSSRFHLTLPAQTDHLQLARLMVAAIASDALSVEEIEDVKVAIEELSATVMRAEGEPDLHLEFLVTPDSLSVHARREIAADADVVVHDFLSTILEAVCDEHGLSADAGVSTFHFVKNARGQ